MWNEWRIKWAPCPWAHNPARVFFLWANGSEDARRKAYQTIERTRGIPAEDVHIFSVTQAEEYQGGES